MGYQALLFCPDEKLARVVSQVFSELDFAVEPVHEPFAAVKKLMAQRYDAVVVDCENEQNASLLFKSARNSSFNQSSLAIALVEGQAGVAKAYRIGANLVLTKPINVEQAKGTLRVARGLLRKNSEAASAAPAPTSAKAAPGSAASSLPSPSRSVTTVAPPPSRAELPELEAPLSAAATPAALPAMTASASVEDKPAVAPMLVAHTQRPATLMEAQLSVSPTAKNTTIDDDAILEVKPEVNNAPPQIAVAPAPVRTASTAFKSVPGSAAAPAPAKEATAPPAKQSKTVEFEPARKSQDSAPETAAAAATMFQSTAAGNAPSFAALGGEDSEASESKKKILIAGVAVLALAMLGYFGYEKFGRSTSTTTPVPPVTTPQNTGEPAPTLAPMSAPLEAPTKSAPDRASYVSPTSTAKATAATLDKPSAAAPNSPTIRIGASPEAETQPPVAKPIVVKSGNAKAKTAAQAEESAPALPSTVASASDNNLSGLIASGTPNLPKPTLATLRISQGVSQGLVIKRVPPKYPPAALAVHAQGAVQIEATITKEGVVTNVKVLSGDPVLAHAAVEAVRQWRYKPYYLDGEPVEIQTQITVNFKAN
jgi:protein TonB